MKVSLKHIYIPTFILSILVCIGGIFIHFIVSIITFREMLHLVILVGSSGILSFVLRDDDPLGRILSGERFKIVPKKMLLVSAIGFILGLSVLFETFFSSQESDSFIVGIIFGFTCIVCGVVGFVYTVRNLFIKKDTH